MWRVVNEGNRLYRRYGSLYLASRTTASNIYYVYVYNVRACVWVKEEEKKEKCEEGPVEYTLE